MEHRRYSAMRSATNTTRMRTADSTRIHSLLMASAARAVPKTVRVAPAIQKISVVVCGAVLAKKIKPTVASIFKKIEVPEMSSFTRLSYLRGCPGRSDARDAKQINQKVRMPPAGLARFGRSHYLSRLPFWGVGVRSGSLKARQSLPIYSVVSHTLSLAI
jgi:hypothetical protein